MIINAAMSADHNLHWITTPGTTVADPGGVARTACRITAINFIRCEPEALTCDECKRLFVVAYLLTE
jgi:hypothetical protein